MVGRVRIDEVGLEARRGRPVELAAVHDHSPDRGSVAADPLGGRVDDDVGAPIDRPGEDRGEGVVDDDGDLVFVGDGGDALEIGHVQARVADRLEVDGLGPGVDRLLELGELGAVDEAEVDAVLGQGVLEEVVRAAVQRRAGDDVVAGAGEVEDRQRLGRLAGCDAQRPYAALEGGDPLLEDVGCRVHDPGVDVAEFLQPEEPGGVVGVVEDVAGGGVDRDGARLRRGIDLLAGMDGESLAAEGGSVLVGHDDLLGLAARRRRQAKPVVGPGEPWGGALGSGGRPSCRPEKQRTAVPLRKPRPRD